MIPVDLVSFYVPMATGACEKAFNRIGDVDATVIIFDRQQRFRVARERMGSGCQPSTT